MKTESTKTQTGNIKIFKSVFNKNYCLIHNNLINDNRLTPAQKGVLIMLLSLPNNFTITTRATSHYLNISNNTFIKFLENYKKLGYLKIIRKANNYYYEFTDTSEQKIEFNYQDINKYTLEQLNYFAKNSQIETKYKNLIYKAIEEQLKDIGTYNNFINNLDPKKKEIFK